MTTYRSITRRLAALLWATATVLTICLPPLQGHAAQRTIAYQGFLSTTSGTPLNGDFDLTFRLYHGATDGVRLWKETHTDVPVRAGLFLVALGAVEPLENVTDLLQLGRTVHVSIEVETDGEMAPRLPLATTPFALASGEAQPTAATVDCTQGQTIEDALGRAPATGIYTITLIGTCSENLVIERDNVVIQGTGVDGRGSKLFGVTPNSHPGNSIVYIDGAHTVGLFDLHIEGALVDATGMHGVTLVNGASGGLFGGSVRYTDGVGVRVLENSTMDVRAVVADMEEHCIKVEGNSNLDLQDALVERCGQQALLVRRHASATTLRTTLRDAGVNTVSIDERSILEINGGTRIESSLDGQAALGVYRGSSARQFGTGSVIAHTRPADFSANPFSSALALDVEIHSVFRNHDNLQIDGWVAGFNLSTIDLRDVLINGHVDVPALDSNVRLRDQTETPGKVTLNGNIRAGSGILSIRTNSTAALVNGDVDCRGFASVNSQIVFKDPEDGYINCPQFSADLNVALADEPDPVAQGQNVTYTATITNETLSPAVEAVNVIAAVAATGGAAATILDATFTTATATGACTVEPGGGTANCSLGFVRTGPPATVVFTVRADAAVGPISVDITLSQQNLDPDNSDDFDIELTTIN